MQTPTRRYFRRRNTGDAAHALTDLRLEDVQIRSDSRELLHSSIGRLSAGAVSRHCAEARRRWPAAWIGR